MWLGVGRWGAGFAPAELWWQVRWLLQALFRNTRRQTTPSLLTNGHRTCASLVTPCATVPQMTSDLAWMYEASRAVTWASPSWPPARTGAGPLQVATSGAPRRFGSAVRSTSVLGLELEDVRRFGVSGAGSARLRSGAAVRSTSVLGLALEDVRRFDASGAGSARLRSEVLRRLQMSHAMETTELAKVQL